MTYKTILVCLANSHNAERLTRFAAMVARKFDAHLIGLHTMQALTVYPGINLPVSRDVAETFAEGQIEETKQIEKIFNAHTKNEDFVSEWRSAKVKSSNAANQIVHHARCADLVIVAQPDPEHDRPDQTTLQRSIIEESGRPVLVMPNFGDFNEVGEFILVGWAPTKEGTRAAHDAIPFMLKAKETNILSISKSESKDTDISHSANEIAAVLDRNGVKVNVGHRTHTGLSIGDEILNQASDSGADLIISGAYGHSRIYDFMVGATTPHLMKHMTVPVLFSC